MWYTIICLDDSVATGSLSNYVNTSTADEYANTQSSTAVHNQLSIDEDQPGND